MAIIEKSSPMNKSNNTNNEDLQARVNKLLQGVKIDEDTLHSYLDYLTKNNIPLKRCVFYGRVSTKLKEQMSSIINQHGICEDFQSDYLHAGFVVLEEVYERESATNIIKRKKFIRTISRAKAGEFDYIVFKCIDRSFRNCGKLIELMDELVDMNIGLIFIYDNLNSLIEDDRPKIIDRANKAEEYSINLSRNGKRAIERNIRNGKGRVPSYVFGYDKPAIMDSSKLYINDLEAEQVNKMYDMVIDGLTLSEIIRWTRANSIESKLGKQLTIPTLRLILRNKIYTGWLETNKTSRINVREDRKKTPVSERHLIYRPDLRIMSDEKFNTVQNILDDRKIISRAEPQKTIFKSLITCDCCGRHFWRTHNGTSRVTGKRKVYWKCAAIGDTKVKVPDNIDCDNKTSIREEELVDAVKLYMIEMLKNEDNIRSLVAKTISSILSQYKEDDNDKYKEKYLEAEKKYKIELDLVREGLVTDKSRLKRLKDEVDDLKRKHDVNKVSRLNNYDSDELCDKLFTTIEDLVEKGFQLDKINAETFNGLFDSVIATTDGRLIFNFKASKRLSLLRRSFGESEGPCIS